MITRSLIQKALLLRNLKNGSASFKQTRNGHGVWSYRIPPAPPSKKSVMLAEGIGALVWFWIFYHIATEPEHIYGEWKYVDPSVWTDDELGIPDDSYGQLKRV